MQFSDMKIGNVYSFSTYSTAFLGARITRAKLIGSVNAGMARKFSPIDQTYPQVFPTLPQGSVYDVDGQQYFLFEQQNGSTLVMAKQWINESSLEEIQSVNIVIRIEGADASAADKASRALKAAGINDFSYKIE